MRPDIVALLRSSECSYLRQLIGTNPVAVFRWGILRATIRTLAVFNKAGRSWAEKHPGNIYVIYQLLFTYNLQKWITIDFNMFVSISDQVRRYSRRSLGEMRRPSTVVERLKG